MITELKKIFVHLTVEKNIERSTILLKKRKKSVEYFDPDPQYTIKNDDKDYIIDEEEGDDDDDEN